MTPADILVEVSTETGVTVQLLLGPSRYKSVVAARCLVAQRLRNSGLSLKEIGKWLGDRHHTSVLYYLRHSTSNPPETG